MKKNIIIFGPIPPPVTGANISNQLVFNILKDDYNVFLINNSIGFLKPKNNFLSNFKYAYLTIFMYLKSLFLLARISKQKKIYAFYFLPSCNFFGHLKDSILLLIFGNRLGNIIGQLHNSNFKYLFEKSIFKYFTHKIYRKISLFIFSSRALSVECDMYIPQSRKTYFYNTINPKVYCSADEINLKISSKTSSSNFKILFVGHMIFSKGCFDLLKAGTLLKSSGISNFKLTFIGGWLDIHEEEEFNIFLRKNNMEEYVECLGIIQDPAILKSEYLDSDIFALPTYYPYESQPLAIIDAMNAGNPIISTDQGTIAEFVKSGINGYIVNKHNPQQICDSIEKLMDQNKWLTLAKQARTDFEENFSLDIYKKNLLAIFK